MGLFLKGGMVVFPDKIAPSDIFIEKNKIKWIGRGNLPQNVKIDKVVDCSGKLILSGNVNGHGHIYSTLARGMPLPHISPNNFYEILKYIWWVLDQALDEESLYYSTVIAAIEAVKAGTTTIIDHHASPNFIDGSLDVIEGGLKKVGVRGVLSYEVTDRNGKNGALAGIRENERFIKKTINNRDSLVKGMVGGHATFTMDEDSLERCAEVIKTLGVGFHIHLAEDLMDKDDSYSRFGVAPWQRLLKHNLLNDKSIIAHGVHLTKEEKEELSSIGCYLAHNPRSNMNNSVGYARPYEWKGKVILGTDGIGSDMFVESLFAYFKIKDNAEEIIPPKKVIEWLWNSNELLEKYWGERFGKIEVGAIADIIILGYNPPTPLNKDIFPWHWMFGLGSNYVETVIIDGRLIMENRKILTIDEEEIFNRSLDASKRLWSKL